MKHTNFNERITLYKNRKPSLLDGDIGVLLFIDNLYQNLPEDLVEFKKLYAHFDPSVILNSSEGIIFLEIAKSKEPTIVLKHRLNNYINIKFNYLGNSKSYKENMKKFAAISKRVSNQINYFLDTANLPRKVKKALQETVAVRECNDFYNMLALYKNTSKMRIKYEILRKLGMIVLLSRISRSFLVKDIDFAISQIENVFKKGLGLRQKPKKRVYLWLDEKDRVVHSTDKAKAQTLYKRDSYIREKYAKPIHDIQVFEYKPSSTRYNSVLLHMEIRNKLRKNGELFFASLIEKIIRKNLQFPNQVHDVMGVKLIVPDENHIPQMISDLTQFLGGSSTRKKEKNTLNNFGKRRLSEYSSKEYYVWKAIYDIALPHPSIRKVLKMLDVTKQNIQAQTELSTRLNYFKERPQDFVVEVQIQDINSYLCSIAKGSTTDHALLKMNQIRSNSFYKIFPKEIYDTELIKLKNEILGTK